VPLRGQAQQTVPYRVIREDFAALARPRALPERAHPPSQPGQPALVLLLQKQAPWGAFQPAKVPEVAQQERLPLAMQTALDRPTRRRTSDKTWRLRG